MIVRRSRIAVFMIVIAAVAAEMVLLPCWLFDAFDPPAPFEVRDLSWGFWPVLVLVPLGLAASAATSGRNRCGFAVASVVGLGLASVHIAATRFFPVEFNLLTGQAHTLVYELLPACLQADLIRRERLGEDLTAWFRVLDLMMALPSIGLSLLAGKFAQRWGCLGSSSKVPADLRPSYDRNQSDTSGIHSCRLGLDPACE